MARKRIEAQYQISFIEWVRYCHPEILAFAIPNGGSRNVIEAKNLKRQGVMPGVPDIFVASPNQEYAGLFLEMKSPKGRLTPKQQDVQKKLSKAGYGVKTVYSIDEAINTFVLYMHDKFNNLNPNI